MYWRVVSIHKRINKEIDFQLAIRGHQPVSGENQKPKKLTDEQEKAMAIALQRAKERKAREYGRKVNN